MPVTTTSAEPVTTVQSPVILLKQDYELLNDYVKNLHGMQVNEKENFYKLSQELGKAKIVEADEFPLDTVRLDSTVVIRDLATKRDMTITIVMPPLADIKQRKVSVLAPIGTALIGFPKGKEVSWEVPAGKKDFMIMEVDNSQLPGK
jgi:regulator of nucleoside diphosphate kinase